MLETQKGSLALVHHQGEMISLVNQTRMFLKENRFDIQQLQKEAIMLEKHVSHIISRLNTFEQTIHMLHVRHTITTLLATIGRAMNTYHRLTQTFHRQRIQLEQGQLTDEILPEPYLEEILLKLKNKGHDCADLRWYYQYGKVKLLLDLDHELVYQTILPGVSEIRYLRYKINYYPIPLDNEYLRQVVGRTDIVLDSVSSASFVPMHCMGERPTVCAAVVESIAPTCESNLLTGHPPQGCGVRITARGNRTCEVYREEIQLSTVVIVPYVPIETTLRCPGRHPEQTEYSQPTILSFPRGCTLQSKTWKVRSVDQGQSHIRLAPLQTLKLPGFNITFPSVQRQEVLDELKFSQRAEIPLLDFANFKNEQWFGTNLVQKWGVLAGAPIGLTALLVIILIVVLKLKGYCDYWRSWSDIWRTKCWSRKAEKGRSEQAGSVKRSCSLPEVRERETALGRLTSSPATPAEKGLVVTQLEIPLTGYPYTRAVGGFNSPQLGASYPEGSG